MCSTPDGAARLKGKMIELPFCECGCGERVSHLGCRFVYNHHWRGRTHTDESRVKISEAQRGGRNHFYGKTHSEETKRKIANAHKARDPSVFSVFYGKKHTLEARRKMSESHKGKKFSAEHRRKISEAQKRKTGERNQNWQGGKSFEAYGPEFNGALKRAIRERGGFVCKLCGAPENGLVHDCHHIDYVKTHNDPGNFCLLCHSCHSRTNSNRAFWTNLFQAQAKLENVLYRTGRRSGEDR